MSRGRRIVPLRQGRPAGSTLTFAESGFWPRGHSTFFSQFLMGTTKNHCAQRSATSLAAAEAPRFNVLEALEDAIESLEELNSGNWNPDTNTFESVLIEYRKTVAWAKERVTLFILTDEDAQAYADHPSAGQSLPGTARIFGSLRARDCCRRRSSNGRRVDRRNRVLLLPYCVRDVRRYFSGH